MGETTTNQTEAESRGDIYQRVTDSIVAALGSGTELGSDGVRQAARRI